MRRSKRLEEKRLKREFERKISQMRSKNASKKIQKTFREHIRRKDPITLDQVELPMFITKENKHYYFFSSRSISDYILSTGDLKNPLTRNEFTLKDIKRLQVITKQKILKSLKEIQRRRRLEDEILRMEEFYDHTIFGMLSVIREECARVDTDHMEKFYFCIAFFHEHIRAIICRHSEWLSLHFPDELLEKLEDMNESICDYLQEAIESQFFYEKDVFLILGEKI